MASASKGKGKSGGTKIIKNACKNLKYRHFHFLKVELPGVEPGSKQGDHMLSTCLVPTWFSCISWIRTTDLCLISLILQVPRSEVQASSEFPTPPDRIASEQQLPGDVLFQFLEPELS
jgi:hypothetical protein